MKIRLKEQQQIGRFLEVTNSLFCQLRNVVKLEDSKRKVQDGSVQIKLFQILINKYLTYNAKKLFKINSENLNKCEQRNFFPIP